MVSKDTPILDDWEDVADDNLSVVSLPTSDDEDDATEFDADVGAAIEPDTEPVAEKQKDNHLSPVTSVANGLASLSIDDKKSEGRLQKKVKPEGADCKIDPQNSHILEHRGHSAKDDSGGHDEARLGDNLDVDLDPEFLQKVCTSTVKLIGEILSIVHFGSHRPTPERAIRVRTGVEGVCKRLRGHLHKLTPILEGYSKHWNPEQGTVSLPIDPGLYEWMSDLKVNLLGVQALLQSQLPGNMDIPGTDCCYSGHHTFVPDLVEYERSLNDSCDQMAGFLPIMVTDYDDFHTANMPWAEKEMTIVREDAAVITGRHHYSSSGPATGHAQLRGEVYELKDQVTACVQCLQDFFHRLPQSPDRQLVRLYDSYETIKDTLEILLSNHASEWIDHGLAGGITFPEFYRTNPDTVRSLNVQLKELAENFRVDRDTALAFRYTRDPDMVLEEEPEVRASDIEALKSIEEILVALFHIKKR
ncbi:hypothetical protein SCUP515_13280 [Seiridium cupressi]